MNARYWTDVLRLLCMMILIDGKVYEEELEEFKSAALALRDMVDPKLMLTGHMAQDWFELNRDDIAIGVTTVFYESNVVKTLKNLNEVENKKGLSSCRRDIPGGDTVAQRCLLAVPVNGILL